MFFIEEMLTRTDTLTSSSYLAKTGFIVDNYFQTLTDLQVRWTTDIRGASTRPQDESARPHAHPSAISNGDFTVAIQPAHNLKESCAVSPDLRGKDKYSR